MAEKYKLLANKLELELRKMRSSGTHKLPSEQDLCKQYSCSRQTVRAALDVLRQKGLIVKRTGSGSYIADTAFTNRSVYFMTEDVDKYLSPTLIAELKAYLSSSRYDLLTFSTEGRISNETRILQQVIKEHPAALIIEPLRDIIPNPNNRMIEEIISSGIPVIYCNYSNTPSGAVHVAPDNRKGASLLVRRLAELGKKNIACIFRMDDSTGLDRYSGYIDTLAELDLPFDEHRCLLLSYKDKKGTLIGNDRIISQYAAIITSGVDAVVCQNDMVAYHLMEVLIRKGIKVPDDITIASFDNSYYAQRGAGFISLGCEEGSLAKALARTTIAAAEGRAVKDVTIPWKIRVNTPSRRSKPDPDQPK